MRPSVTLFAKAFRTPYCGNPIPYRNAQRRSDTQKWQRAGPLGSPSDCPSQSHDDHVLVSIKRLDHENVIASTIAQFGFSSIGAIQDVEVRNTEAVPADEETAPLSNDLVFAVVAGSLLHLTH
jgi:hypothetical protein